MPEIITFDLLKRFFIEIFNILKDSDPKVTEVWIEPSEVLFFIRYNKYQINEFLEIIDSVSIKKGNYSDYIVINKIIFIVEAIKLLDLDIRDLALIITFDGFEALIAEILKLNNYKTLNNFRFSDKSSLKNPNSQKRYEIDVIAVQKNYMLLIDAKQWKRKDSFGAMNKAGNLQFKRVNALVNNPEVIYKLCRKLRMRTNFEEMILIPFMVSLEQNFFKMNENKIPLVSICQLNSFLQELFLNKNYFKTIEFSKNLK
jgi:hypothetical protein